MAKKEKLGRIPLLEWISAGIGLLIAVLLFAFLIVEAISAREGKPPLMEISPAGFWMAPGGYVVELRVSNYSRETGAEVQIEGKLMDGTAEVEASTATISYVPGKSHRRGGLFFSHDPRKYRLELRATGYEQP